MNDIYKKHLVYGKEQIMSKSMPQKLDASQRIDLYDSNKAIEERNWNELLALSNTSSTKLLNKLQAAFVSTGKTNCPAIPKEETWNNRWANQKTPIIFCEFGMGFTTYQFLKWCEANNGYLITVEMPIGLPKYANKDNFPELYYHGVDRYKVKYNHCMELLKTDVAKKHWLWINDDIFEVVKKITTDEAYRKKLFFNGKIDYFYEDAIHCDEFLADLLTKITPFMNPNSVFTGDDNTPTKEF